MKSILDRSFRYTKAAETTPEYLRAKFRRLMREQAKTEALEKRRPTLPTAWHNHIAWAASLKDRALIGGLRFALD